MERYLMQAIDYIFHHKAPAKKAARKKARKDPCLLPKPLHKIGYTYSEIESFLTKKELKKFNDWMYGQTCGVDENTGQHLIYAWDVQRFVDMVRKGTPTYWD